MRKIKVKWMLALMFAVAAMFFLAFGQRAEAAGNGWYKVAFDGSEVSFVMANPYRQAEVLAVVDNVTKITLDGGLLWRTTPLPSKMISLAFDPVHPDEMYAGTQQGLYYSSDLGNSWQLIGNGESQAKSVTSVAINNDAIFTTESAGLGNGFEEVFKFSRSGETTKLSFPTPYAEYLTTDESTGVIYAGTHDVLYRSSDNGVSWLAVAGPGPGGIGAFTGRLVVHNGQIWQSSADGIFVSGDADATWHQYAGYPGVTELYPNLGSSVLGLAVNGPNAFFGITNSYGSKEMFEVNGQEVIRLDLHDYPADVAAADGHLWVGGRTGLWRQEGLVTNQAKVQRPVVVVPGTMGSWSVAGHWKLDPIGRTYDNLMKTLEEDGYVKGVTLFDFPYNWRLDNNETAQLLLEKIAAIRQICTCSSVDVIAHSQGGLVARAYIEGSHYGGDVENLIELGTPNAGSVEDYSIWEAGVSVDQDVKVRLGLKLFKIEAIENGYANLGQYIRTYIPSVGQLLPNYSYIKGRTYPGGYPANGFLDTLNASGNLALLKSRTHLHIVGSDSKKTLAGLEVGETGSGADWANGKITNKVYGLGDGTVPIDSLQSIAHASLLLNEDHGGLAKHPSQLWLQDLLGDQLPDSSSSIDQINRLMLVYVESPVRIAVMDPYGNQVNDYKREIDGAFYTGSDEQVQFVTIPNPVSGTYYIRLSGKGDGKYKVGVSTFDDLSGDTSSEQSGVIRVGQDDVYEYGSQSMRLALLSTDENKRSHDNMDPVKLWPITPVNSFFEPSSISGAFKPFLGCCSDQSMQKLVFADQKKME